MRETVRPTKESLGACLRKATGISDAPPIILVAGVGFKPVEEGFMPGKQDLTTNRLGPRTLLFAHRPKSQW